MTSTAAPRQLSFLTRLERISDAKEYFAVSVPEKISRTLKIKGPVPVSAQVNTSRPFLVSLFPVGNGRHKIRIKAEVRAETKIKEGDPVRLAITVRDLNREVTPPDLLRALQEAGLEPAFLALPPGKRSYSMRKINQATKPETRLMRIAETIAMAELAKVEG